jgi:hypothetical protein
MAQAFTSKTGRILAGLITVAQTDLDTLIAYREGVLEPRRAVMRRILQRGIAAGELRPDLDPDTALDTLFGPFLTRLLLKHGPIDDLYVDRLADTVLRGIAV